MFAKFLHFLEQKQFLLYRSLMKRKLNYLRLKYPTFTYKKFDWRLANKDLVISLVYSASDRMFFKSKVKIKNVDRRKTIFLKREVLDNLIFHLGIIEGFFILAAYVFS